MNQRLAVGIGSQLRHRSGTALPKIQQRPHQLTVTLLAEPW